MLSVEQRLLCNRYVSTHVYILQLGFDQIPFRRYRDTFCFHCKHTVSNAKPKLTPLPLHLANIVSGKGCLLTHARNLSSN